MVRKLLTIFVVALFLAAPNMAGASEPFSPWVEISGSRVRLVGVSPWKDGALGAGLQLQLAEGWKTYWLNPGPSGIPPKIDFSASENVANAEVLWPAPERFKDGDADSLGYKSQVMAPLRIVPIDAAKPVLLKANFEFGLCEKICVPAQASLEFELTPGVKPDVMTEVLFNGFKSRVPVPATLNDGIFPGVTSVERFADSLLVSVGFQGDNGVRDLFAKADGHAVALPQKNDDGKYSIALKQQKALKVIDLVVVDGTRSRIVPVSLDDLPAKP